MKANRQVLINSEIGSIVLYGDYRIMIHDNVNRISYDFSGENNARVRKEIDAIRNRDPYVSLSAFLNMVFDFVNGF